MAFTSRFDRFAINFELNGIWNSVGSIAAEMCTKYRKYLLRSRLPFSSSFFFTKVFVGSAVNNTFHLSSGEVTEHLAVQLVQWLQFRNCKIFSTCSLLFGTLITLCFIGTGTELRTRWFARLEPEFVLCERKNNWIPQQPHRYRSCRIQVGDLNNTFTSLLRQ
jgi:hypothetical protein